VSLYIFFTRNSTRILRAIPTRRQIVARLSRHPHILLYARSIDTIAKGKISLGLRSIAGQIRVDLRNFIAFRMNKRAAEKLVQLYQEAILCCIQHRVNRWWDFLPNAKFDSIPTLEGFLSECLLRRAGDYHEFIRIKDELRRLIIFNEEKEDGYYKLAQHYAKAMNDIEAGILTQGLSLDASKRPFLIAFSVWGERYLSMLLNYCLPSLMAKGNLGALCKERQPILFIHTDLASKQILEQAEIVNRIKALGVKVHYRMLDIPLIVLIEKDSNFRYWHLGMVQSLDLYLAKALNADFHLLLPDVIYSDHHFSGILRAVSHGHKAISRLGLSTCMEEICPAIDRYRQDGVIEIPAGDLAALSVKHIHSASWSWIATNKNLATELPTPYMIAWEGKDTLHMLSPHQTILYLDRELLRNLPKRFYITLDSELDKIIPANCPIYCPRPEDAMYLVEVTSVKQRPTEPKRNSIEEFCRTFWYGAQASMSYWRFFDQGIIDPINRGMLPDRDYMSDELINNSKKKLKNALLENYPTISDEQARLAL
jgi:hypothetical protein